MKSVFHSLLVWLMLAALPLQGFASASMALCGLSAMHAPMQMPMPAGEHDHAAMLAAQAAGQDSQGHDGPDGHGAAKCRVAGDCCVGALLAPAMMTSVPALAGGWQAIPFQALAPPVVDLALPERPPQSFPA